MTDPIEAFLTRSVQKAWDSILDDADCSKCKGTGTDMFTGDDCRRCNGTGETR